MKKMHWLASTSHTADFKVAYHTMCEKSVGGKAATRDHRDVTCMDCVEAMEAWARDRFEAMDREIARREAAAPSKPGSRWAKREGVELC